MKQKRYKIKIALKQIRNKRAAAKAPRMKNQVITLRISAGEKAQKDLLLAMKHYNTKNATTAVYKSLADLSGLTAQIMQLRKDYEAVCATSNYKADILNRFREVLQDLGLAGSASGKQQPAEKKGSILQRRTSSKYIQTSILDDDL